MQAYYQQALVTLAADRAIGDHESFLQDHLSVGNSYKLPFIDKDGEVKGSFFVGSEYKSPEDEEQRSHLAQRAWTLQEDWLSVRSIHFYSDQMVWECQTDTLWASDIAPQWIVKPARRQLLHPEWKDLNLLWFETVDEYASRRLTVSSDLFPAISGLARAVRSRSTSEMTYAAGIWLEDWQRGILWSSKGFATQRTSDQYIAPSWSWGSLEFKRSLVEEYCTTYQARKISSWWCPYERIRELPTNRHDNTSILLDCKMETMDGDVYGRISSGILSLRGCTLALSSSLQNTYKYYIEGDPKSGLIGGKEKASTNTLTQPRYPLSFTLDTFQHGFSLPNDWAEDLLIMDIARMREYQWALVLRPVPGSRFYERVGVMEFDCESEFSKDEAWEVRDIDII
jgi:hypothetical protein